MKDSPGFWINRILGPYMNEAAQLLVGGTAIEEIDRLMVEFGFPVGPIALLDEVGLDVAKWEACYDGRKYQKRIAANLADGLRRGVNSTPTFVIGSKMYPGMRTYDEMKKLVDSVARSAPSPVASSSPTTPATRK